MTFADIEAELRRALARPLPGLDAQRALAPRPRAPFPAGGLRRHRDAAALLLLFPAPDAHMVLTVRTQSLPRHGGQVSLPGGAVDAGETIRQAALREAHEEIGVDPATVTVLGELTPLEINVSRFLLHPVVGTTPVRPPLRPAEAEV